MSVFIALSVVDTVALGNQFTIFTHRAIFRYTPYTYWSLDKFDGLCQLINWLETTAQVCSAYFVLLFTIERFISVRYPLKRAIICTKRRINFAILGIVIGAALTSAYELYYYRMHTPTSKIFCVFKSPDGCRRPSETLPYFLRDLNVNHKKMILLCSTSPKCHCAAK